MSTLDNAVTITPPHLPSDPIRYKHNFPKEIDMTASLQARIDQAPSVFEMLYNSPVGPFEFPIPSQHTNWIDEQHSWRQTVCVFDLSYHMTDYYLSGPDVHRLLSDVVVNSMANFGVDKAKQIVACNYDGYVIGDAILFGLDENEVCISSGRPTAGTWIAYHADQGGYDVDVKYDPRIQENTQGRTTFRYQVQGPDAWALLEKVCEGSVPDVKFFNIGRTSIAGIEVRGLRHGMAGEPGLELFGPMEHGPAVKAALLAAGREFGVREAGARAYSMVSQESGWIPSPLPAIYSGDQMKPFREWLPGDGFEANISLGGSFVSQDIEDYYVTPWDLGYGRLVRFDHDFIGRDALERLESRPHKRKVTLLWNDEDVIDVFASMFSEKDRAKYLDMPGSQYSACPYDRVLSEGEMVGFSTYAVYSSNFSSWISLAMLDGTIEEGADVTLIWGEPDGGSAKPTVERHVQTEIRAKVAPAPLPASTRESYRAR